MLTLNLSTLAGRLADQWRRLIRQPQTTRRHPRLRFAVETLESRQLLTTFTVTTNIDELTENDTTSLREAVELANVTPGDDRIVFADSADGSIDLVFGQLQITESVTIEGNGATRTVINGQHASRLLDITAAVEFVVLDYLTIANGKTSGDGEAGGGIRSLADALTIEGSAITGNSTTGSNSSGGGIFADQGDVSIISSTVSGNSTSGEGSGGGGIRVETGVLNVQNSTVSGNTSLAVTSVGGALSVDAGGLSVISSTVAFNSSNAATLSGGGIFANSTDVTLINSIVALNTNLGAPDFSHASGNVSIINTLIGSNLGTTLLEAQTPDADGNLIGTSLLPIDPKLGSLAYNGGLTQTHALLATSPAIDRGSDALVSDASDQRGGLFTRIVGGSVDLGAFERQSLSLQVTTADDENDEVLDPEDLSLREALALANAYPGMDTITFASSLDGTPVLFSLGELTITDDVRINGSGADLTVLDAQGLSRVFNITSTAGNVTLQGLTITNGTTTANGESGGGIRSASTGTLTIANSSVSGNTTEGDNAPGGGIFLASASTLILTNSTISGNVTSGSSSGGGGIHAVVGGTLIATGTRISSNGTSGDSSSGGGLYWNTGSITLEETIVSDNSTHGTNSAGGGIASQSAALAIGETTISGNITIGNGSAGGGIYVANAAVTVDSSTISENSTHGTNSSGGGLQVTAGTVSLVNSTISANGVVDASATGGGLSTGSASLSLSNVTVAFNFAMGTGHKGGGISSLTGPVTLLNSIVAQNTNAGAPDLDAGSGLLTVGYTLIGDNTGTSLASAPMGFPDANGNLIGTGAKPIDPQFGSFAAFGGFTKTYSLQGISPAINAGSNVLAGVLTIDQRGLPRIFGDTVDMGAFEHQSVPAIPFVTFSNAVQSVSESEGTLVVTLNLSFVSPRNVTIPLLVSGTATGTADYSISTTSLLIVAGTASGTFTINLVDDVLYETNETIILGLGTISNGDAGSVSEQTITITNNDVLPTVDFSTDAQSTAEGSGVVTVTVNLSAASGVDTTVPYTLSGSAGNPGDYTTNASTILVIPAGATSGAISFSIVDDHTVEVSETLVVTLGAPTNGSIGVNTVEAITIADNDNTPPVLGAPGAAPHYRYNPKELRAPVKVFSEITVTDDDGPTELEELVISVSIPSGRYRDVIAYTGASSLGTISDSTVEGRREIRLTLLSGVTTAQVQTFLRSVTFETSRSGSKNTTPRNFQVSVRDKFGAISNVVSQNVAVSKD